MANKNKRFEEVFVEGSELTGREIIIVDKETGVNYLVYNLVYGSSITPLLDSDGNVIVSKP